MGLKWSSVAEWVAITNLASLVVCSTQPTELYIGKSSWYTASARNSVFISTESLHIYKPELAITLSLKLTSNIHFLSMTDLVDFSEEDFAALNASLGPSNAITAKLSSNPFSIQTLNSSMHEDIYRHGMYCAESCFRNAWKSSYIQIERHLFELWIFNYRNLVIKLEGKHLHGHIHQFKIN